MTVAVRRRSDDVPVREQVKRCVAAQRAVSEVLLVGGNPTTVLKGVGCALSDCLASEFCVLWTRHPRTGELVEQWLRGARPAGPGAELLGAGACEEAWRTGRTVCRRADDEHAPIRSGVWMAVVELGETTAVIELLSGNAKGLDQIATGLLSTIGAQVGHTIQQRRVEARLLELSEQNRRILAAISESVLGLDAAGVVTFANAAAVDTLGASVEDLVGTDVHALVHGDGDHPRSECLLVAAAAGNEVVTFDVDRFAAGDGPEILVECTCSPLASEHGRGRPGAVLTFRDVTQRRAVQEAWVRDLNFLHTLLESTEEGVVACDADGVLTVFNHGMRTIMGRKATRIPSEEWTAYFDVRDPDTGKPLPSEEMPLIRALHGEVVRGARMLVIGPDGESRELAANARQLIDAQGETIGAVGVLHDTTVELSTIKRMEEAERVAGLGAWTFDLETREVFWSPGLYHLLGLDPELVKPSEGAWEAVMHPDDREPGQTLMREAVANGQGTWEGDFRIYRSDGELRTIHLFGEALPGPDGVVHRIRGSVQDTTERSVADARARQLERMDSLGQLAGGIAHDFNNLLAVILSYTEFALEDLEGQPSTHEDILEINKAAHRAADLTRRLLVFSRREVVRPQILNVNDLFASLKPVLLRTLGEHLEMRFHIEPHLPLVSADAGRIEQMLLNLALNARDAMAAGGVLTMSADTFELEPEDGLPAPGQYLRVRVSDTGIGMSPDVAAHVFEPFFTTKPKGRGTGLGLSTAYGVVNEMGGSIDVESSSGKGSTFTVLLPVAGPDAAYEEPAIVPGDAAEEAPTRAKRVLLVEDESTVREAARRILERDGCDVLEAADGGEALGLLVECDGAVDLLLTDLVMPGLSGWELHAEVAERWPGIPTLFMSGYTADIMGRDALSAEGIEFIAKPFVADALLQMVRSHAR